MSSAKTPPPSSDERFRTLANTLPVAVYTLRPDGTPEFVNQAWEDFTGLEVTRLEEAWSTIHPDDRERFVSVWESSIRSGEAYQLQYRSRRADGVYRWQYLRTVPVRDAEGRLVQWCGAAMDIDDHKHAEDAVRRAEVSQRLLVSLHDATRLLRDPTDVMEEFVNRVGRHFGVSRCTYGEMDAAEEWATVARDFADGVPSAAGRYRIADFSPELLRAARAGQTLVLADVQSDPRLENELVRAAFEALAGRSVLCVPLVKDGRFASLFVLVDHRPRPWTADEVALVEQVAERTWFAVESARAQAALRESRDVLSLAMRGGRMGAWSRDLATNRVWWSRELEELFGLEPGGFEGTEATFYELVHEDDRLAIERAVAQALASHQDYVVELRFRHASGEWRWMEGRGRAVYGPDGAPVMLYGLGIDITERKRGEAALRDADRRKDEFLATLAHELRNPLAPIQVAAEIIRRKDSPDPELRAARDIIDRQTRQMTRLVDDLLDGARITRGRIRLRRERIELAAGVRDAIDSVRPLIEGRSQRLQVDVPPDAIHVDADPMRLSQVLENLLDNAAKYTPPGGNVWLTATREGGHAVISVRDDGSGIAPDQVPHLFEMFSQISPALERPEGGLGIGLALVRGLVELHGGRVEARSDGPGRGSEFIVRLPLADTVVAAAGPSDVRAPAAAGTSRFRVLVVDDNPDATDSLGTLLEIMGHEVHCAYDGLEALRIAESVQPDVVLLDIGLPGIDGYEAARRIRQQPWGRRVTLVAVTGWGQDEDKQRALEAGFDHHLTKPLEPAQLEQLLVLRARR